jgi:hypothetical protein
MVHGASCWAASYAQEKTQSQYQQQAQHSQTSFPVPSNEEDDECTPQQAWTSISPSDNSP